MDQRLDTWTSEGVKGGLVGFYRGIAGVGLVFPRADRPIAVKWAGHAVSTLRPIEGLEFVEETVAALGYSTELAHHLFRECWAEGTGSDVDLCRAFGWEVEAHKFKVAMAADLVCRRRRHPAAIAHREASSLCHHERGPGARCCPLDFSPE
jgi:hypothetical protein